MKAAGRLRGNTAVVTVMSNYGFFQFAKDNGIDTRATKVGDRYVLETMLREGFVIGGEQSGHIIFSEYMTTGDGQLSAIQLMPGHEGRRGVPERFGQGPYHHAPGAGECGSHPGYESSHQ